MDLGNVWQALLSREDPSLWIVVIVMNACWMFDIHNEYHLVSLVVMTLGRTVRYYLVHFTYLAPYRDAHFEYRHRRYVSRRNTSRSYELFSKYEDRHRRPRHASLNSRNAKGLACHVTAREIDHPRGEIRKTRPENIPESPLQISEQEKSVERNNRASSQDDGKNYNPPNLSPLYTFHPNLRPPQTPNHRPFAFPLPFPFPLVTAAAPMSFLE